MGVVIKSLHCVVKVTLVTIVDVKDTLVFSAHKITSQIPILHVKQQVVCTTDKAKVVLVLKFTGQPCVRNCMKYLKIQFCMISIPTPTIPYFPNLYIYPKYSLLCPVNN